MKRWSKEFGGNGLTEYERGKVYTDKDKPPFQTPQQVKEGPSYEYANYMKKIEKAENQQAKEVNNLVKLLQKKGLKKEATLLAAKYMRGTRDFNNTLEKLYRKIV